MWLPSRSHDLLLRAALTSGEGSVEAWREWVSGVDWDRVDGASARLFPLLYRHLEQAGIQHAAMAILKRHLVLAWMKNARIERWAKAVFHLFRENGLELLVLKGLALAPLAYSHLGERPMNDLDILVRPRDVSRAWHLLEDQGWRSIYGPGRRTGDVLAIKHSAAFLGPEGEELDLHGHALILCPSDALDEELWRAAASARPDPDPGALPTLCPTDHLLVTCLHGLASELFNRVPCIHWVADALGILRSSRIDFERMLHLAELGRLTLLLEQSLAYLRGRLDAPIPDWVLVRLEQGCPERVERVERFAFGISSPNLREILLVGCQYLRWRRARGETGRSGSVGRYLRHAWSLDSGWGVVPVLVAKAVRNTARIAHHYLRGGDGQGRARQEDGIGVRHIGR
jgi:hypothetical protein